MACNLRSTPARTQQRAFFLGKNVGKRLSCDNEVMETPTELNSNRQGIDKSTESTFDG